MKVLRTPDERFKDLADYPFEPHYTNIVTDDGTELLYVVSPYGTTSTKF